MSVLRVKELEAQLERKEAYILTMENKVALDTVEEVFKRGVMDDGSHLNCLDGDAIHEYRCELKLAESLNRSA